MPSVLDLCAKMADQRINSKKFGEILQIDGMPLWHFLDPFYLPRPFKHWSKIDELVKKGVSWVDNFKTSVLSVILRKELMINEKFKLLISRRKEVDIKPEEKDVLFLTFTNQVSEKDGKLDFLGFGDVVKALERKKVRSLILVCDPLSNPFFRLKKYKDAPEYVVSPYEYMDNKKIMEESKYLSRKLNRKWETIDKSKLFAFREKNYWDFIKNEMNFILSSELLSVTLTYYLTFKKIIQMHNVKGVYVVGWGIHGLALLAAARKLGRWIMCSPHGYGGTRLYWKDRYEDVIFLAAGEGQRKELLKWGIEDGNIFVTGSPFFDEIAKYKSKKGNEMGKIVTLLPTALVEYKFIKKDEYFNYIRKYLAQTSKVKNVEKIIIKLHPDEKYKSEYESVAKSLKLTNVEVVQRPRKEFLYSILRDSDLVISFGSTADIEGLMLDKNVVVIEGFFGDLYRKDPYKQAVIQVEKDDDLTSVVDKVLNNKRVQSSLKLKREKYLKKAFYKIDGKAHERVADLIVSLLKK